MATVYSWTLERVVDGSIELSSSSPKLKRFMEYVDHIDGCAVTTDGLCLGVYVAKNGSGYWGYAERHADGRLYLPLRAESMHGEKVVIPARFHIELELGQDKIYGRPEKNDKQARST